MTQTPIADWKKVPSDARIRGLVLGKLRRTADSPLGALQEFCHCASVVAGSRMTSVMRSGKFNGWLGYSGVRLVRPVKCSVGIYVSSQADATTNLMRIALLAEALGISSACYVLHEEKPEEGAERAKPCQRKPVHRIAEDEATSLKPLAIVFGSRRIAVQTWNECLPEYVKYVKASVPFGEQLAPAVPVGYERFDAERCLRELKSLIEASGLDRYSVCLEFAEATASPGASEKPQRGTGDDGAECPSAQKGDRTILGDNVPARASAAAQPHFRRFRPDACVW